MPRINGDFIPSQIKTRRFGSNLPINGMAVLTLFLSTEVHTGDSFGETEEAVASVRE